MLSCRHVLEGHSSWVSDAALTASGHVGITSSGDELAVAWDLTQGSHLRILEGHCAEIRSTVLTERGRQGLHAMRPILTAWNWLHLMTMKNKHRCQAERLLVLSMAKMAQLHP